MVKKWQMSRSLLTTEELLAENAKPECKQGFKGNWVCVYRKVPVLGGLSNSTRCYRETWLKCWLRCLVAEPQFPLFPSDSGDSQSEGNLAWRLVSDNNWKHLLVEQVWEAHAGPWQREFWGGKAVTAAVLIFSLTDVFQLPAVFYSPARKARGLGLWSQAGVKWAETGKREGTGYLRALGTETRGIWLETKRQTGREEPKRLQVGLEHEQR